MVREGDAIAGARGAAEVGKKRGKPHKNAWCNPKPNIQGRWKGRLPCIAVMGYRGMKYKVEGVKIVMLGKTSRG
jgi:hypothetical protein